jgi:hypothetical protein
MTWVQHALCLANEKHSFADDVAPSRFEWKVRSLFVNRRGNGSPDRRAKGTPWLITDRVAAAFAPAKLVGIGQPGRARFGEEPFTEDQARFLKRQLSLPVSTMSQ